MWNFFITVLGLIVFEAVNSIDNATQYSFLKNGAMTSIGFLGIFMIFNSLGGRLPEYLPTLITFSLVGLAFWKSKTLLKRK